MSVRARIRGLARGAGIGATAIVAAALACDSPTGPPRGPGGIPILQLGKPQSGTVATGGTNSFLVVGPADTSLRIFLRAASGRAADSLIALVGPFDASGSAFTFVRSGGTDATLGDQSSESFRMRSTDTLLVTVRALRGDDGGPYEVLLRAPDPRPETAAAALVPGDTLRGEAIDVYGDVDEFTFDAMHGDEILLFLRAASGDPGDMIRATLFGPAGQEVRETWSDGDDAELTTQTTGRFALPATGRYTLRLEGGFFGWDDSESGRGPYELLVYPLQRAPELGSDRIALGDTLDGAIESVGDIDEISFTAEAGEQVELNVQLLAGLSTQFGWEGSGPAGLFAELWSGGVRLGVAGAAAPAADLDRAGTGRVTLPSSGTYTVRVFGSEIGTKAGATGRYRVELYLVNPAPETGSAALAISDTVAAETLARPADIDEYSFAATEGEMVSIFLAAPDVVGYTTLLLELFDPSGQRIREGRSVPGFEGATYVGGGGIGRFVVPASGTYTVRVSGPWWRQPSYPAPYVLELYGIDTAPESVPAEVHAGDVVSTERIDRLTDIDRFQLQGTEGEEVNIFLRRPDPSVPALLFFEGFFTSFEGVSGIRRLTRTGDHLIEIVADDQAPRAGAYELEIYPVNRAPEAVAATYVVGDTITVERIDRVGDIDEFTFTAVAGEKLRIFCEAREGGIPRALVCSHSTEVPGEFRGVMANRPAEQLEWGDFVVPQTGTYQARVSGYSGGRNLDEYGEYRFALVRLP